MTRALPVRRPRRSDRPRRLRCRPRTSSMGVNLVDGIEPDGQRMCSRRELGLMSTVRRNSQSESNFAHTGASALAAVCQSDETFDFFRGVQLAMAGPGTRAAGCIPCDRFADVRSPEWPGTTLLGTGVVDAAAPGLRVEERAVPVGELSQGDAATGRTGVQEADLSHWLIQQSSDGCDLLVVHPDEARLSGAARSAARTGEGEAVVIPRPFRPGLRTRQSCGRV